MEHVYFVIVKEKIFATLPVSLTLLRPWFLGSGDATTAGAPEGGQCRSKH